VKKEFPTGGGFLGHQPGQIGPGSGKYKSGKGEKAKGGGWNRPDIFVGKTKRKKKKFGKDLGEGIRHGSE